MSQTDIRRRVSVMSGSFEKAPQESGSDPQPASGKDALVRRVLEALYQTGYFIDSPCEVKVEVVSDHHVVLAGTVDSYYLKQRAQAAVMSVEGVRSLQNNLVVLN